MRYLLDGKDWEADYFISLDNYKAWLTNARNQHNMLMESVHFTDFVKPGSSSEGLMTGTIPGSDRSFLMENDLIEDPYFGRNLDRTRWVEEHAWAFRKRFTLPAEWKKCRRVILRCAGLDYEACIFINGTGVQTHKGMFIPLEIDITRMLDFEGENMLAIGFEPMPQASPNHHGYECAEFTRYHRLQMSYGWDWARAMSAASIWDSVELIGYGSARLKDKYVSRRGNIIDLSLDIESLENDSLPVKITVTPENFTGKSGSFSGEISVVRGSNTVSVSVEMEDLHLWYPLHYGAQDLYRISVTLNGENTEFVTGFKDLEMRFNPDSPENCYPQTFTINGKEIFARGLNYVPADLMFAGNTPETYDRLVRLAAEAGFNLFRIWGGGMVEKNAFYEACDRYGIMVWQEFMHSCSNYPKDSEFLAFKKREGEAILRKIRNHVCISMLCGGNEMQYYGEIPDSPLLTQYAELTARFAPGIPYHVSCPDFSRPGERNHGPWTFQEHSVYNNHFRLVASEIGCNGMPEYHSLTRFIPAHEIAAMQGQSLRYHFMHPVTLPIPLKYFDVQNMQEMCNASMAAQADACGYFMAHYRRLAPQSSGCFIWQYNEPWPTCSFSIVDYYTVPKMAYYALAKSNSPLLVSMQDESWCSGSGSLNGKVFLTCETPVSGTIQIEIFDICGKISIQKSVSGSWENGSAEIFEVAETLPPGIHFIRLSFRSGDEILFNQTRIYGVPDFKNAFKLPETTLEVENLTSENGTLRAAVTNTGNCTAVYVRVNLPEVPEKEVFFKDNYFIIPPGESAEVIASIPADAQITALEISGWNC